MNPVTNFGSLCLAKIRFRLHFISFVHGRIFFEVINFLMPLSIQFC